MPQLARRSMESGGPRTRVLLVRQPMRSVRGSDHADPLPVRLAIAVIAAVGGIIVLWLIGLLGYELGFKPLIDSAPMRIGFTDALVAGVLMLMQAPLSIFQVALHEPLWFMIGFLLISIPAGGLGAARQRTPGGPRPHPLAIFFAYLGAIAAALFTVGALLWLLSPLRDSFIARLPTEATMAGAWADDLRFVAGLDLLMVCAAVLWVVLVARLPIPRWLRAITATATISAAIMMIVATAMTTGPVAHIEMSRAVLISDDDPTPRLILGEGEHHTVLLERDQAGTLQIRLAPPATTSHIRTQSSLVAFLEDEPEVEADQ